MKYKEFHYNDKTKKWEETIVEEDGAEKKMAILHFQLLQIS